MAATLPEISQAKPIPATPKWKGYKQRAISRIMVKPVVVTEMDIGVLALPVARKIVLAIQTTVKGNCDKRSTRMNCQPKVSTLGKAPRQ